MEKSGVEFSWNDITGFFTDFAKAFLEIAEAGKETIEFLELLDTDLFILCAQNSFVTDFVVCFDSGKDRCEAKVTEDLVDSEFILVIFGSVFLDSEPREAVYGGKVTNALVGSDCFEDEFFELVLDSIERFESDRIDSVFFNLLDFVLELDLIEAVLEIDLKSEADSETKLIRFGTV